MLFFGLFKKKKNKNKKDKTVKPSKVIVPEPMVVPQPIIVDPEPVEPLEADPEVVKEDEEFHVEVEPKKEKKERELPYHITKHPKGGWQIKRGKAERALKRFDTQKEAIAYAKELEQSSGVSYIIHKADGSIRKKEY